MRHSFPYKFMNAKASIVMPPIHYCCNRVGSKNARFNKKISQPGVCKAPSQHSHESTSYVEDAHSQHYRLKLFLMFPSNLLCLAIDSLIQCDDGVGLIQLFWCHARMLHQFIHGCQLSWRVGNHWQIAYNTWLRHSSANSSIECWPWLNSLGFFMRTAKSCGVFYRKSKKKPYSIPFASSFLGLAFSRILQVAMHTRRWPRTTTSNIMQLRCRQYLYWPFLLSFQVLVWLFRLPRCNWGTMLNNNSVCAIGCIMTWQCLFFEIIVIPTINNCLACVNVGWDKHSIITKLLGTFFSQCCFIF